MSNIDRGLKRMKRLEESKEPLKQKGRYPSLENTTHNRVLNETSLAANQLAIRWGCTKLEVYRWLVKMALEGKVIPDEVTGLEGMK